MNVVSWRMRIRVCVRKLARVVSEEGARNALDEWTNSSRVFRPVRHAVRLSTVRVTARLARSRNVRGVVH